MGNELKDRQYRSDDSHGTRHRMRGAAAINLQKIL
jgi:hypothetical protein